MKKKITAVVLTIVLVFSLSVTAMAAGGASGKNTGGTSGQNDGGTGGQYMSGGNAAASDSGAQIAARTRIRDCLGTMTQTREMSLECKAEHIQLSTQLRTTLRDMKANGTTLSEETLTALAALKTQLQTKRDELAATNGNIEALMVTFRELKQAGNLEAASAILDQVLAIQQTRLQLQTDVCAIIQQMINLLTAI